ncbi:DEAD/DEAH box helicase [Candidatus Poribacteria bacterium]|mgnify:FL=1|nr:DEAD/DEAH box helicase [Candidatus Poribacteria bacterium]MCH2575108.1 DEAD/DEAH box helicase [Candidatus Poribacteria bacterium]
MKTFSQLNLIEPLLQAVSAQNYQTTTPIQEATIPPLLAGKDVLGCAQTGTGKTAAFTLPILQKIAQQSSLTKHANIRALVLAPTRELASQIGTSFEDYGQFLDIRHSVIFGGVNSNRQIQSLKRGIHVLIATPGRLLDLQQQGFIDLSRLDFFVLDEADRMLDMGFIKDIQRIISLLPTRRQNLLFSATMPDAITKLADSILVKPFRFQISPQKSVVQEIQQEVMFVQQSDKRHLLLQIIQQSYIQQAIVFMRTKHRANRLTHQLNRAKVNAVTIHGDKSQAARQRALRSFREGKSHILVATDLAARGLDIDGVSHVFNFDLPNETESYVHRIGRTGRAGRSGMAIAFCAPEEYDYLTNIEKTIGVQIPVSKGDPGWDRQPIRIEGETENESKTELKKFGGRRRTRKTKQNNYKRKQTRFRRKHPSADQSKSQVSGQ